jgi:hypothetical protein
MRQSAHMTAPAAADVNRRYWLNPTLLSPRHSHQQTGHLADPPGGLTQLLGKAFSMDAEAS